MAQITKTVIYPLPTEWYGDEQDNTKSGICTYVGPDKITLWYENYGTDENPSWELAHAFPSDPGEDRDPPFGAVVVELNADTHPLHVIANWGGIEQPNWIETPAGPDDEPNPILPDYHYFNEVFDMRSFGYNVETKSWNTPRFSGPHTEEASGGQKTTGWDYVRVTRDRLLANSDNKIPADAPEDFSSAWKEYRQKLRDLPVKWASVGDKTYLIVWPREPGDMESFMGISNQSDLECKNHEDDNIPNAYCNKVFYLDGRVVDVNPNP